VDAGLPSGTTLVEEVAFGTIHVNVIETPADPVRVVARVGIGDIDVNTPRDVTVAVRGDVDHGDVRVNGVAQHADDVVVGPEGPPDVVIDASILRGSVDVEQYDVLERQAPRIVVPLPDVPGGRLGELRQVADGVAGTSDGWIVLADGEAVISPDDRVVAGETYMLDGSTVIVSTSQGDYRLLPRSILLAPTGEVLDLAAIRDGLAASAAAEPTEPTEPATSPTAPPEPTTPGG
jgi:hypothetical protein